MAAQNFSRHQSADLPPLHVSGHVRDHHAGPHQRRPGRAHPVRAVLPVHSAVVDAGLCPAGPLGLGGGRRQGNPADRLAGPSMGALDFAGGTVVHIAAGFSGLAAILVLRKRLGYPEHAMHPNSMVLTLIGAGLLWFGWFGFNGGSALASNGLAAAALARLAGGGGGGGPELDAGRMVPQGQADGAGFGVRPGGRPGRRHARLRLRHALAGLRDRPGCRRWSATAVVCLKPFFKYDDSLDAFGVHGVGGFLGALLTGVFADRVLSAGRWRAAS